MLMRSPAQLLASLPASERQAYLDGLSVETKAALRYHWRFWARPNQIAPGDDWSTWLILAGRGFGKTEAGAQWIHERVKDGAKSIALIAETQKDLEEVMVARLVAISPPDFKPAVRYKPVRIAWPNGAVALGYNGNEPDQLRGPEFDTAWCDELAKYRYARDTWDMLQFTMRKGNDPRVCVTTTPRPIPIIRELMADSRTVVARGRTVENADNLAESFMDNMRSKYEGTRLGRQELDGEILDDVPGALWTRAMLEIASVDGLPEMSRVVVAVDPSGTNGDDDGDEIGIIVAGRGVDGRGYVIEDRSCKLSPDGWARRAVQAYYTHNADRLVAERNFGGAMVASVIRTADRSVSFKEVTASRGKAARAEPIAALYEQGRISHIKGLGDLEDQMTLMTMAGYAGDGSPDRVDALVWALTELMLTHIPKERNGQSVTIPPMTTGWNKRNG
jgi:predicted phage terminase large subunit-like protein